MIVCSCHGVTDRELRASVDGDRPRECRAGTGCGGCVATISAILAEVRRDGVESSARDRDDRRANLRRS